MPSAESVKNWAGNYKDSAEKSFRRAKHLNNEGESFMRRYDELMAWSAELELEEQKNGNENEA